MEERDRTLVDTVLALFMKDGARFKMEDVAARMKISKKTIYKDYGNKEDLIILVVKATFEGIEKRLEKVLESDAYDSLEKLILLSCAFPDAKVVDYHKAMLMKDDFPKPYEMFISYIEDNWTLSRQLFEQCIREGRIREMDHELFRVMVLGITKQILGMKDVDQEALLESCIRNIFMGIQI